MLVIKSKEIRKDRTFCCGLYGIAFGALIALICLTKTNSPSFPINLEISIKQKRTISSCFYVSRDEPDAATRLTIYFIL